MSVSLHRFDALHAARVCGLDEAGRGPLAGPVVAAAVIWPQPSDIPDGLNDSKLLSAHRREELYEQIVAHALVAVSEASVNEIDQLNILHASMLAMQRAFERLNQQVECVLVDGNHCPKLVCKTPTIPVIGGDGLSASIAAASIIAKVTRDRMMSALAEQFPDYGFENHRGYATAQHRAALSAHGVTVHHRRSFAPVRALLEDEVAA